MLNKIEVNRTYTLNELEEEDFIVIKKSLELYNAINTRPRGKFKLEDLKEIQHCSTSNSQIARTLLAQFPEVKNEMGLVIA